MLPIHVLSGSAAQPLSGSAARSFDIAASGAEKGYTAGKWLELELGKEHKNSNPTQPTRSGSAADLLSGSAAQPLSGNAARSRT
jgi:hypothetical protein